MTKLVATAAIAWAGAAVLLAQSVTTAQAPAATAAVAAQAADAKTYRASINQYCVGCHNSRSAQPASHPVDLEKASLDDVVADAATWERVLRKLSVRAMPPQACRTRRKPTTPASRRGWRIRSIGGGRRAVRRRAAS